SEFYDTYIEIMENNFSPDNVNAKIDEYVAAYEDATRATNTRFGVEWANYNYNKEVQNLRNFFNERPAFAKRYLDVLYGKIPVVDGETIKLDPSRFTYYGDADASYDKAENSYYIKTYSVGENAWDIQTQTPKFNITKGKTYRVSFKASCSSVCSISATINHQSGTSWPSCWSSGNIYLNPMMSECSYMFTSGSDTDSNWQLCFNFGTGVGKYTIKDVEITEVIYQDELLKEGAE
ncbi:MAG: carbohydrate binding domain-containing protein, partial [Ruminococcus sp.]